MWWQRTKVCCPGRGIELHMLPSPGAGLRSATSCCCCDSDGCCECSIWDTSMLFSHLQIGMLLLVVARCDGNGHQNGCVACSTIVLLTMTMCITSIQLIFKMLIMLPAPSYQILQADNHSHKGTTVMINKWKMRKQILATNSNHVIKMQETRSADNNGGEFLMMKTSVVRS